MLAAKIYLDGQKLYWTYYFKISKTITGLEDRDSLYPFTFANAPLAMSSTVSTSTLAGQIHIEIYSTTAIEPKISSSQGEIPHKHKFTTKPASKKGYTVGTTLGDPLSIGLPPRPWVSTHKRDALLQSFKFQVKSPLAMLAEKLMLPCWTFWWGEQKAKHGNPSLPRYSPSILSLDTLPQYSPSILSLNTLPLEY